MRTITNNEDDVRLRVYEGELLADDGVKEMLRLEQMQRKSERLRYEQMIARLHAENAQLRLALARGAS